MADLIDRQAAIKAIEDLTDCYNGFSDTYDKACIIGALQELPSAERHSRRKAYYHGENAWSYVCEACGTHIDKADAYCRGCGARMEADE